MLTNQNHALRTCVWFFWFAFKRKFYATGPYIIVFSLKKIRSIYFWSFMKYYFINLNSGCWCNVMCMPLSHIKNKFLGTDTFYSAPPPPLPHTHTQWFESLFWEWIPLFWAWISTPNEVIPNMAPQRVDFHSCKSFLESIIYSITGLKNGIGGQRQLTVVRQCPVGSDRVKMLFEEKKGGGAIACAQG